MEVSRYVIAPERLRVGARALDQPLAIVDLDADEPWPDDWRAPAGPLIGLGRRDHPRADALDAIIEPDISAGELVASVTAQPFAAQVFTALMRMHAGHGMTRRAMLDAEALACAALAAGRTSDPPLPAMPQAAAGRVEVARDGDVLQIKLDSPAAGNAIDAAMRVELDRAFVLARTDPSIARIRLAARGAHFCLGTNAANADAGHNPARALAHVRGLIDVHVEGGCVGAGLEIAAFGTWITAAPHAWFQMPDLARGTVPGTGGSLSLPRRIGRQRTALMVLSGARITAPTAQMWGLMDAIADEPHAG